VTGDDLDVWEHQLEERVAADTSIRETDREAIIRARRGQGLFKQSMAQIESRCRVTGVDNRIHLVASHCKPWRDPTIEERLTGEDGLLSTLRLDHPLTVVSSASRIPVGWRSRRWLTFPRSSGWRLIREALSTSVGSPKGNAGSWTFIGTLCC
jgi:hypothetical protein